MTRQMLPWEKAQAERIAAEKKQKEEQKRANKIARAEARAERIAERKELKEVHKYIRKYVSFLPLESELKLNPKFNSDIADGVYAMLTLQGSSSGAVSALENLARDAMRNNCSFVNVNNTVVLQQRTRQENIGFDYIRGSDVYRKVPVPPEITYFATGFYRKKPKSK